MNAKNYKIIKDYFYLINKYNKTKEEIDYLNKISGNIISDIFSNFNDNELIELYKKLSNEEVFEQHNFTMMLGDKIIPELFSYCFEDFKIRFLFVRDENDLDFSKNSFKYTLETFTRIGSKMNFFKNVVNDYNILINALENELSNFKDGIKKEILINRIKEMKEEIKN